MTSNAGLRDKLESDRYWRLLGVRVEEISDGYCRLRLPLSAEIRSLANGPIHPGALACLVELAVGTAADSLDLAETTVHATVELSVSLLAPASEDIVAEGRILRAGDYAAKGEAELRDASGQRRPARARARREWRVTSRRRRLTAAGERFS